MFVRSFVRFFFFCHLGVVVSVNLIDGLTTAWYHFCFSLSSLVTHVAGSVLSLRRGWGIAGLWISMTYVLFGVRMAAHLWRFNSKRGPFGPSAFLEYYGEPETGVQNENRNLAEQVASPSTT